MTDKKRETPLLDELEKGPWPSFVTEIKKAATQPDVPTTCSASSSSPTRRRGPLEARRHRRRAGLRRRRHRPLQRPRRRSSPTSRTSTRSASTSRPAGSTPRDALRDALRHLGEARLRPDQHARLHRRHRLPGHQDRRAGADLQGADRGRLRPRRLGLRHAHAVAAASGQARCEWACYDTHEALLRPDPCTTRTSCTARRSPTSSRSSVAGCPNDCVASIARADLSIIGTWKDDIQQDDAGGGRVRRRAASTSRRTSATAARPGAWTGTARR